MPEGISHVAAQIFLLGLLLLTMFTLEIKITYLLAVICAVLLATLKLYHPLG